MQTKESLDNTENSIIINLNNQKACKLSYRQTSGDIIGSGPGYNKANIAEVSHTQISWFPSV